MSNLQESPAYYSGNPRSAYDVGPYDTTSFLCIERLDGGQMYVNEQVLQVTAHHHGTTEASQGEQGIHFNYLLLYLISSEF